jgi:hypothetical protein
VGLRLHEKSDEDAGDKALHSFGYSDNADGMLDNQTKPSEPRLH